MYAEADSQLVAAPTNLLHPISETKLHITQDILYKFFYSKIRRATIMEIRQRRKNKIATTIN